MTSMSAALVLAWLGAAPPAGDPALTADTALQRGRELLESNSVATQLKGARLLLRAYELAPDRVDTQAAACEAWFMRADQARQPARAPGMAKKITRCGRRIVRRWPARAEGYYWTAVGIGCTAMHGSVMDALNEGVADKIERLGRKAVELDRTLYGGAPLRLLGRYYQKLPWPLTSLDKARPLLEEALRIDPDNITNQRYLAELLATVGEDDAARRLFERCARGDGGDRKAVAACRRSLDR